MNALLLALLIAPSARSLEPLGKLLRCTSDFKINTGSNDQTRLFEPGVHSFDPDKFHRLEIIDQQRVIARIYPLDGLHSVAQSPEVEIETDKKNYVIVRLKNNPKKSKLECRF